MNIVTLSYVAAAIAFALLATVLLTAWRGNGLATRFLIATIATVGWALIVVFASQQERVSFFWVYNAEVGRDASWLDLRATMARGLAPRALLYSIHPLWISLLLAGLIVPLLNRGEIAINGALWLS